ncbi:MAG: hypothetical protein HEEMFOPI_00687 [Holosporales bacterium]
MTYLKKIIEQHIDNILKIATYKKSEIEKVAEDSLMRCDIERYLFEDAFLNNFLEIGLRKNYYDRTYKKGWPIYVRFDYTFTKTQEELIESILELGMILRSVQEERSWMIHKIINENKQKFEDVFQYIKLKSIILRKQDGSVLPTTSLEYYAVLSFIKEKFLNDELFYFNFYIILDLFNQYDFLLMKSFNPYLKDGLSLKPVNRIVTRFNDKKSGSQFFGTDSRSIDYSLSAHKDNFNNAQTEAKRLDRYCSINEDPNCLLYWLKRYQLRPTYASWQDALHYVDPFSWL